MSDEAVGVSGRTAGGGDGDCIGGAALLTFQSAGREFAIDIMTVRELRGSGTPTPLPHAPPYMMGVMNLRGAVLPVLDLARRLGPDRTPPAPRNVVVVIEQDDRLVGLLVDAVSDIVHPAPEDLREVPDLASGDGDSFGEGLLMAGDRMIQILSVDSLLPQQRSIPGAGEA